MGGCAADAWHCKGVRYAADAAGRLARPLAHVMSGGGLPLRREATASLSLTCQKEEKVESDDDRESAKAAKRKKEAERRTATAAVRRRGERIANSGQSRLYQMRF